MESIPKYIESKNENKFIEILKKNPNYKLFKLLFIILLILSIIFILLAFKFLYDFK